MRILLKGAMNKSNPFSEKEANDSTGFLLWQVTTIWQRAIAAALRPHGITQVQYALLASLLWLSKKENQITQTRLAQHTQLDVMMTSQVLRALEAKGFVRRLPHPKDTRAKLLSLTKNGKALAFKTVPIVEKADAAFFEALGSRRSQFNQFLLSLMRPAFSKRQKSGGNHVE